MGHDLRWLDEGRGLVEVSNTTFQRRYLLEPATRGLNEVVIGVFARAQAKYGVEVCALTVLSTHYHALLRVASQDQLSDFMCFVGGNLSKEVGKLINWSGALWSDRFHMIPVSHEDGAEIARLKYVLGNSVKEGLVSRPQDWPGVNSAQALIGGKPLEGVWIDRTKQDAARRRKNADASDEKFSEAETLHFSPLPCWDHLSAKVVRRLVAQMVKEIEDEGLGEEAIGAENLHSGDPHYRSPTIKKSPQPRFHAATRRVLKEMCEAYAWVVQAYREAAERLKEGDRAAPFPEGTFPPRLPFVAYVG